MFFHWATTICLFLSIFVNPSGAETRIFLLLMSWFLAAPVQQQPCYWLGAIWIFLPFCQVYFNSMWCVSIEEWYEMQIYLHVFKKEISTESLHLWVTWHSLHPCSYPWFNTRLQYLQCALEIPVLHQAIDNIMTRNTQKYSQHLLCTVWIQFCIYIHLYTRVGSIEGGNTTIFSNE